MIEKTRITSAVDTKEVTVYLSEEQQSLREAYRSCLTAWPGLELVGISGSTTNDSLAEAVAILKPSVLVLGIKVLQPEGVKVMELISEVYPEIAILLLASYYDVRGIEALKDYSRGVSTGYAYLLKHTIKTVEQLTRVVFSVSSGQITIDGPVMDGLMSIGNPNAMLPGEFEPQQVEALTRLATAYRANRYLG